MKYNYRIARDLTGYPLFTYSRSRETHRCDGIKKDFKGSLITGHRLYMYIKDMAPACNIVYRRQLCREFFVYLTLTKELSVTTRHSYQIQYSKRLNHLYCAYSYL